MAKSGSKVYISGVVVSPEIHTNNSDREVVKITGVTHGILEHGGFTIEKDSSSYFCNKPTVR